MLTAIETVSLLQSKNATVFETGPKNKLADVYAPDPH